MDPAPAPPRRSPWWLAAAVVVVIGAAAWAAGASGSGTSDPVPTTGPAATDPSGLERVVQAEAFWWALGDGDLATVMGFFSPGTGSPLTHYAGYTAAFEAGYEPQGCRVVAADSVRCTLRSSNPDLIDLYWVRSQTTEWVSAGTVAFDEGGITGFQEPGLVTTATPRLVEAAVAARGALPDACDRLHHDAADLPPIDTGVALTADCAAALLPYLQPAIAAQG
ncbi:MAG: hypothetical protein KQH83_02985 [Actinobacteria bacterium]|nr:hypothetical protein [Actinomycetota bacterium]